MKNNYNRLKTASRLKNWIACNYTTVNEINKKDLKKKDQSTTEIIRKKEVMNLRKKFIKNLLNSTLNTSKLKMMMIKLKQQKMLLKRVMI